MHKHVPPGFPLQLAFALSIVAIFSNIARSQERVDTGRETGEQQQLQQPPDQDSETTSVFLIGNSLTWDTKPSLLDGDVQWHVDCGKSLKYIHQHPEMPCVKSSTLWPQALASKQYDYVTLQPHYGTTLEEDLAVIEAIMKLQPQATIVIHTGWAKLALWTEEYADDDPAGLLTHGDVYFRALMSRLKQRHPHREFRSTGACELLSIIDQDIQSGRAPLMGLGELYRDAIHMTTDQGRYLMHNAMRRALGQPVGTTGFEMLAPKLKTYFDEVLERVNPRTVYQE